MNNNKISLKEIINDPITRNVIILNIIAYLVWFAFWIICYPLQVKHEGGYNIPVVVGLTGSFIVLLVILFYLDRLYHHRVYQLRTMKSRERFRKEMRELEENWKLMKMQLDIEDKEIFDYEKEVKEDGIRI